MPNMKEFFAGMSSDSGKYQQLSISKKKKKIFLILFASLLVVSALIGVIAGVASNKKKSADKSRAHAILKSSCSSTLYPELCFSELAKAPATTTKKLVSQKDVIGLAVNITVTAVEHNYYGIQKLIKTRKNLTKREKTALHDCLEMIDETLDELKKCDEELEGYPSKKKSVSNYADDLKTLVSAAITNQQSCIDGFSHDRADKVVREALIQGQIHVYKLCSNVLAMICNMTNTDMEAERFTSTSSSLSRRNLKEFDFGGNDETHDDGFPKWLSAGDRRLLQSGSATPDVTVAADGSGNFRTIAAAVAAAPEKSSRRYIIRIKAGVYRENVEVTKKKTNLMFLGDGRKNTIITGSRNVKDGSTTFNSATVIVVGDRFLARGVTFENTAGPSKHQAVAIRVGSDFSAFYQCDMLAYQDTLYVHSLRQFYINCLVAGTVDFIFGNAAVVLQDCDIHARRPNPGQKNMFTAQGRTDPNQNTGIVIQKSRIGATSDLLPVQSSFPSYLGRPWKEYSRTVVMQSTISNVIVAAGWSEWTGNFALNTLFYAEYANTGAGAGTSGRVKWRGYRVLTSAAQAQPFTVGSFLQGGSWLGSTGFPFQTGL